MKTNFRDIFIIASIIMISIFVLKFLFKLLYFITPIIVIYIAYKYIQTRKTKRQQDKDNQIFNANYRDL